MYFGKVLLRSFLGRRSAGAEGGGSSLGAHSGLPCPPPPSHHLGSGWLKGLLSSEESMSEDGSRRWFAAGVGTSSRWGPGASHLRALSWRTCLAGLELSGGFLS